MSADTDLAPGYGVNGLRSRTALRVVDTIPVAQLRSFPVLGLFPFLPAGVCICSESPICIRVSGPGGCRVFRFQGQLHDHDLIIIVIIRI